MASGGIRYDFVADDTNFTQNEDRTISITCYDDAGVPIASFSGWTFAFYIKAKLTDADTEAEVTKTSGAGITAPATAPNTVVTLVPDDTASLRTRVHWYELWRTDTDDNVRLSFGEFPIID